jgi:tRNA A37 threonylcarbamoyladenosine biosynthesis protein TsaE
MATLISRSPEETLALGEEWGRGLGAPVRVHSPTFTLLNEYGGGRLPLFHIDLYRLNNREDVIGAGLEEYLIHPDGITVVEWIERWLPGEEHRTPNNGKRSNAITRIARIETLSEMERRITYEDPGA